MSYKEQVKSLQTEIEDLRIQIGFRQKQIDEIHACCQHAWSEPKQIYGDRPNIHSSRHWERECSLCGKVERTYRENLLPVPDFGNQDGKITVTF
jgi:hypothetical protein